VRLGIHWFGVDAPDVEHLYFWFSVTNPLFIYAASFLFDTEFKASVFVRIFYFTFGAVAPITVMILEVVNPVTKQVAAMLIGYFRPWPIYCLNYGYLSVNQRGMIALMEKQEEDYY